MKTIVIGGGISGLAAAFELKERGEAVELLEASDRVGGWIGEIGGAPFPFPLGPRTVRYQEGSDLASLIDKFKLPTFNLPKNLERYVFFDGKLLPVKWSSPLFRGIRFDLIKGLFKRIDDQDQSVASFFRGHFSEGVATRLGIPFLRGVFGQEGEELSLQAAFPWMKKGLLMPHLFGKKSRFLSLKGGVNALVKALSKGLEEEIFLGEKVSRLTSVEGGIEVETPKGKRVASRVISTLPLHQLSPLLTFPSPKLPYQSITSLHFYWSNKKGAVKGFGYLVSPQEKGNVLGAIFDSELQEGALGSAITMMFSGIREEEEVILEGIAAIKRHLGITSLPDWMKVTFAKEAIPSYPIRFLNIKWAWLDQLKSSMPGLIPIGTSFNGLSVPQLIEGSFSWRNSHGNIN